MSQMTARTAHGRFDGVSGRFTLTPSHSHAHRVNLYIYNKLGDFVRDVRQFFLNKKTKEREGKSTLTPLEVWGYKRRDFTLTWLTTHKNGGDS